MKRRVMLVIGVAVFVVAGTIAYRLSGRETAPTLTTARVTRGDVVETVEATGTLQAVTTVQVGTQVSGTIKALHADFNSRVRRDQVVAELEPSLFEAQVAQARASISRLRADNGRATVEREDAQRKLRRARELSAKGLLSAADLEAAEMAAAEADAAVRSGQAQIEQAEAALHQAQVNLDHTIITAPIDGIVISRNVDVGQTVAASMQAPTLFVIAQDLTAMRVNASIAESDIGRIAQGQPAAFRVDAYRGETFHGRVSDVRLEPVIQQNVVSYTTTIDVANPDLKLKPGMTATVTVEVARQPSVLRVPNAALRVRVSPEVIAAIGGREAEPRATATTGRGRPAEVWVLAEGQVQRVPVATGISNGTLTAILGGTLADGEHVVTSVATSQTGSTTKSPLLPAGSRIPGAGGRGGGRPPGSF